MRLVLDLQACQSAPEDDAARYGLALASALARRAGEHEVIIAVDARLPAGVDLVRSAFDGVLSRESIVAFSVPPAPWGTDDARRAAARDVRLAFLDGLAPDVVHVFGLSSGPDDAAVRSFGRGPLRFCSSAMLTDLDLCAGDVVSDERDRASRSASMLEAQGVDLLLVTSDQARRFALSVLKRPEEGVVLVPPGAQSWRPVHAPHADADSGGSLRVGARPFLLSRVGPGHLEDARRLLAAFKMLPEPLRTGHQLVLVSRGGEAHRAALGAAVSEGGFYGEDVVVGDVDADSEALCGAAAVLIAVDEGEGLGSLALEAMSRGTPVVAAATGALPEILARPEALFPPVDGRALTERLQAVLSDDVLRADLITYGRARAQQYSWEVSADLALEAFAGVHERVRPRRVAAASPDRRPRLAFVSPLPPERTGIADYSATLLPQLAHRYEIDVITDQSTVSDPWIVANAAQRSALWFDAHAGEYDRVLYQIGNSHFHAYQFPLLARHPGVVTLHDFYLSGAVHYCDETRPGLFEDTLYTSHGYSALVDETRIGRERAAWAYPCNRAVLERAEGVIVHSQYSIELAKRWFGDSFPRAWKQIALLKEMPAAVPRDEVRARLGLRPDDFFVCSFGILGPSKLNDQLLTAWLDSPLAADDHCRLVFVGSAPPSDYLEDLTRRIDTAKCAARISITGFLPMDGYQEYLCAADAAVQLRAHSRGETSAAISDCLAYGVPTIANANGSVRELPDSILRMLPDEFSAADLAAALEGLYRDDAAREELSRSGREYVATALAPARIGAEYIKAIEGFGETGAYAGLRRLAHALAADGLPSSRDFRIQIAEDVAANRRRPRTRQILVDVTPLSQEDKRTGIQRVARSVLTALIDAPPEGCRIEPVRQLGGRYLYARRFTLGLLGLAGPVLEDAPVEFASGDLFLGLDLAQHSVVVSREALEEMRARGVELVFVVYDLLPALLPAAFPDFIVQTYHEWLETLSVIADGLVCISRTVADELLEWLRPRQPRRASPLQVGYFHLGADLAGERAHRGPRGRRGSAARPAPAAADVPDGRNR